MSVYTGEEGVKKYLYDQRKALVDQMWERYKQTTNKNGEACDYRILAEICEKLPFFENKEVGQEISRLLTKHYSGTKDYYAAQRHQREVKTILRMWDDFKSNDNSEKYDNIEVRRIIVNVLGGGWNVDRVREVIRERDKNVGQTP